MGEWISGWVAEEQEQEGEGKRSGPYCDYGAGGKNSGMEALLLSALIVLILVSWIGA